MVLVTVELDGPRGISTQMGSSVVGATTSSGFIVAVEPPREISPAPYCFDVSALLLSVLSSDVSPPDNPTTDDNKLNRAVAGLLEKSWRSSNAGDLVAVGRFHCLAHEFSGESRARTANSKRVVCLNMVKKFLLKCEMVDSKFDFS